VNSPADSRRAANPKLPLWDTICQSYSAYFGNFPNVLRISWLWLVVIAPISGFAGWAQAAWIASFFADMKQKTPATISAEQMSIPPEMIFLVYGVGLMKLLAGVSIAVAWHRLILLGEQPRLSGSNLATVSLWRYVGIALAIYVIATLPLLVNFLLAWDFSFSFPLFRPAFPFTPGATAAHPGGSGALFFLSTLVFPVTYLVGIAVTARLSILLPARAAGDLELTLKETWLRTRGNTWRMFWGLAACTLPVLLVAQIAALFLVGSAGPKFFAGVFTGAYADQFAVIAMIAITYYLLVLPICIGFLSLAYRHFALFDAVTTDQALISLAWLRRIAVIVAIVIAIWIVFMIFR
jgi:hypothetical protein